MTTFDERERAYEKKFQIDEELKFKADCLAAKLFGQWAVQQMKLEGNDAVVYIEQAVEAEIKQAAHVSLLTKVEKDFQDSGVVVSRHRLESELAVFQAMARCQLMDMPAE